MRRLLVCAIVAAIVLAAALPAPATADPRWTFCVASSRGGRDVWITDVFATTRSREKLEAELKAHLARHGATRVDVQCPEPSADEAAAVNAQFAAITFNRKLGATLHEVRPGAFAR